MWIPQRHFRQRNAHRLGRVAPQMLIGKEQHSLGALESPLQHGRRIAGSANNAAVASAEGFQIGGRVDVRDRRDVVGVDYLAELFPAAFDLIDRGHVGHRAAGSHVGQNHGHALAAALGQFVGEVGHDIGRLGHEVHAAKGDVPALAAIGRHPAELITIALQIRKRNHFVLLIMVPQNQQPRPQSPRARH